MVDRGVFVATLRRVKKNGGTMDDVVAEFTDAPPNSKEFEKMKTNLSQLKTSLRKQMKEHCEKNGIPVSRVDVAIPNFHEGRITSVAKATKELFDFLVADVEEEITDEESGNELDGSEDDSEV